MADAAPRVTLNDGHKMPLLGLGSSQSFGDVIADSWDSALEAGYRHIDTSYSYRNEAAIGQVLSKWLDSGRVKREELFIVTKLPRYGNRAENVEHYLKKSLEALQVSYVDMYLIHDPIGALNEAPHPKDLIVDTSTDHVSVWKAMEAQVDAGRARSIGLSNFNARQIKRIVKAARIRPANLQVELNVYFQQRELVAFCGALDIVVSAYSPLGSPAANFRTQDQHPLNDPAVQKVADKHGKTPGQVLLRHIAQRGVVAIPKSSKPARIKDNMQVFDFELDAEDLERLDALDRRTRGRKFRNTMVKGSENHPEFPFDDPY